MADILVYILVILLNAYVITYCINAFMTIEPTIKRLVVIVIWALAIISALVKFLPLLAL